MNKYTNYRIGNPVIVNEKVSHIDKLSGDNKPPFDGYGVCGNTDVIKKYEIKPVPLNEALLSEYGFKKINDFVYELNDSHYNVICDLKESRCIVNDNKNEVLDIEFLHELLNILNDKCNIYPHRFQGSLKTNIEREESTDASVQMPTVSEVQ